jgi:hypothetical protein
MQCSECATQLPEGAAYCPSCGNVTPYNMSFSGVAPSDKTVTSLQAQSTLPSSPYPQPPTDPYSPLPLVPPPPPPFRRRGLSAGKMVLLVVLVLLIVGAGGVLYFRTAPPSVQPKPQASPKAQAQQATTVPATGTPQTQQATTVPSTGTPQAQQATATPSTGTPQTQQTAATPSAGTPQDLYNQVTKNPSTLDDSLSANGTSNWNESEGGQSSCQFTGGAYHAIAQAQNTYTLCMAQSSSFGNLAYQVQMTIAKGDFGGMVFRTDSSQTKYYSFFIDRTGTYTLMTSVDDTGTRDYVLHKGTSSSIKTALNQVNQLAVIARGNTIYVYINQQYITSASDNSYRAGQIGLFGGNTISAPADVLFRHVQVWSL